MATSERGRAISVSTGPLTCRDMPKPKPWEELASKRLHTCRVFDVHELAVRSPRTGEPHTFYRLGAPAWVNVIPLTSEHRVVMVHQFRHGSRDLTLETPGGMVDPGESPAEAAARELLEETGYRAETLIALGSVSPNPALFDNRLHVFLAPEARRVASVENDSTEDTAVELVPIAALRRQLADGRIDHALVVAALYLAELRGALPPGA